MSKPLVIIIGDSGTGKSSSIENLPPDRTVIINTENKELPMRNFSKFKNIMVTDYKKLIQILDKMDTEEMKEKYDYVVVDSFTSIVEIVQRYCRKVFTGFEVWDNYNTMIVEVLIRMKRLEQQSFMIALPEQKAEQFGETKSYARIKGKELKYGFLEKEVAIVLFTSPDYDDNSGEMIGVSMDYTPNRRNSAKAPRGMFTGKVTNDLKLISDCIAKYYSGD